MYRAIYQKIRRVFNCHMEAFRCRKESHIIYMMVDSAVSKRQQPQLYTTDFYNLGHKVA